MIVQTCILQVFKYCINNSFIRKLTINACYKFVKPVMVKLLKLFIKTCCTVKYIY